jgi:hypothetical protein
MKQGILLLRTQEILALSLNYSVIQSPIRELTPLIRGQESKKIVCLRHLAGTIYNL